MKLLIERSTLDDIGSAIREKGGANDLIPVPELANSILNIPTGGGEVEPLVLTGSQFNGCNSQLATFYIEQFGNTITTSGIDFARQMFSHSPLKRIPFDINFRYVEGSYNQSPNMNEMFGYCEYLEEVPNFSIVDPYETSYLFSCCYRLRQLPDDFASNWTSNAIAREQYVSLTNMIDSCYSLRKFPKYLFEWAVKGKQNSQYYHPYVSLVYRCNSMDEVIDLAVDTDSILTANVFVNSFYNAYRLKNITFAVNEDGTAKTVNWKSQIISLSDMVGYCGGSSSYITGYNSGITADKEVKDDATYQALKNDPDWFSTNINYSRYNHDSAVRTINSLPDTSAYLATAGGTNTIKFKGQSGALTDGGAINTLTETEIAVATSRGWTVSLV